MAFSALSPPLSCSWDDFLNLNFGKRVGMFVLFLAESIRVLARSVPGPFIVLIVADFIGHGRARAPPPFLQIARHRGHRE